MKRKLLIILSLFVAVFVYGQRQSEELSRGLIAVKRSGGVFISWRITGKEWIDVSYNIYRNGSLIKETGTDDPSNYLDPNGATGDKYSVAAVYGGVEQSLSSEVSARASNYFDIQLNKPPDGTTPDGSYTYTPNDASVADLDGDGDLEIILKWDPSNSQDNSNSGYTGPVIIDAYNLEGNQLWRINLGINIRAGAHYTQFMVGDFDGDGKAEMVCKTADGTTDGLGKVIGNSDADYRRSDGRILTGPEFLTVFKGVSGEAIQTIDFQPARGNVTDWGDNYGNRADRFLACTPYLDGEHPSIVMCRGYYHGKSPYKGKTVLVAYDFKNNTLTQRWMFTAIQDGVNKAYTGQGNHNLSVADVDNDGKDEIIYGAMAIDDDGTGLYATGLGHGDALHVSDMDPDIPGYEVFSPHESGGNGVTFREAATGKIIWQHKMNEDVGRGVAADIGSSRGFESWATSGLGMYNAAGDYVGSRPSTINFSIYWDGDLFSELLDGTSIYDFNTVILQGASVLSNNGTKSTPTLSADILGDWREEVIWRHTDGKKLRIYTTTDLTNYRIYTLLHDSQYRSAVAWQNVAYNQPPHTGFYLEQDMALPAPLVFTGLKWKGEAISNTWNTVDENLIGKNGSPTSFNDGDTVIFSFNGISDRPVDIAEDLSPDLLVVASPDNFSFEGNGTLSGPMKLIKSQKGSLTLSGSYGYTGSTVVTDGALVVNGTLENSKVFVSGGTWGGLNAGRGSGGRLGGSGHLKGGVVVQNRAALLPGMDEIDTLLIENGLELQNRSRVYFDLPASSDQANDMICVSGDLTLGNYLSLIINPLGEKIDTGSYVLFTFTGKFTGSTDSFEVYGMDGIYYELLQTDSSIVLKRPETRDPLSLVWTGNENAIWSLKGDINWHNGLSDDFFLPGDTVIFDETGTLQPEIEIRDILEIGQLYISGNSNYSFSGEGTITGDGGIEKSGTGTLKISSLNTFSGSTIIEGGVLEIDNLYNGNQASNLGMTGSSTESLLLNGGELKIKGYSVSDRRIKIGEAGGILNISNEQQINGILEGNGTLTKSGLGILSISKANPFSGNLLLKSGTIKMLSDNANTSGLGTATFTIENGTYQFFDSRTTFTTTSLNFNIPENGNAQIIMDGRVYSNDRLSGNGNLDLVLNYTQTELRGDWSAYTGVINVLTDSDGGDFKVNNKTGYGNCSLVLNENVSAYHISQDTVEIGALVSSTGSTIKDATWIIGAAGIESVLSGSIQGSRIVKKGSNRLIIDGAGNTYSGGTVVEEGYLVVDNTAGSATGSGDVLIMEKALLGGNGILNSEVIIENGAYLSPGNGIGSLTINNSVTLSPGSICNIEVSNDLHENDLLVVNDLHVDDAILFILNTSGTDFSAGDSYQIFEVNNTTGHFANIYPRHPGEGLTWDTTYLYSNGILRVVEDLNAVHFATTDVLPALYPNPTRGILHIDIPPDDGLISITIMNNSGRIIDIRGKDRSASRCIDIHDLPAGVYLIEVVTNKTKTTRRVILVNE